MHATSNNCKLFAEFHSLFESRTEEALKEQGGEYI